MRGQVWLAIGFLALGLSCISNAADTKIEDELEVEHSLQTDFVTPHTPWAKPYAGGRVRTLFFVNYTTDGTMPREVVELNQRFDLEAQAVFWTRIVDTTKQHWCGGAAGEARIRRLLEKPWDCYVFLGVPIERLGVEEQYRLLEAVTKGAGLVLVGVNDERVLKESRRLPLSPFLEEGVPLLGLGFVQSSVLANVAPERWKSAETAARLIATYTVKMGRGVRLPARPRILYRPGWEVEYDYWQSLFGRAVLWATRREPKTSLVISPENATFDTSLLPNNTALIVAWRDLPSDAKPVLHLVLRGEKGSSQLLGEQTIGAEGRTAVSIPTLPAGQYYVDAIIKGKNGVITWGSGTFQVKCSRTVKEISFERPFGEVGERMVGKVVVDGKPPLTQERLQIDLCDRRNRVLKRKVAELMNDSVDFVFPLEAWMPMLVRVEATLLSSDTPAASAYAFFNVTRRNRGQFNFLMWDLPRETMAAYAVESLSRLGVTLALLGGRPILPAQAYDIAWVPYTTHIDAKLDEKGIMKPCCWNDEPAINKHVESIVSKCALDRQSGVFVYSLGDEVATRGSCLHPACLAAFRNWLKEEYKTIDALNASWGTAYTSFDEANLDPPADNNAAVAKAKGNLPRWYDRQAFQCYNFTRLCKRFVDAFTRLDPYAKVGFEGAGSFAAGDDYDLIVRTNGFWSPYPGLGDEIIRSIAPRDFPRSNWMGYTKDADSLLSKYWRMITRGCDSVWWWRWNGVERFHGFLAPHLGPYEATREMVKDTQIVRDGLGTLLLRCKMLDDGIAILYSMPSAYATSGSEFGRYASAHEEWSRIIRELGLQYRYVTDRMLRREEFQATEFKALILPRAEALGMEEAAVLRRYVENGGTLIADLRPGLFDGHCKARNAGILDDVFGVQRSGDSKPAEGKAQIGQGSETVEMEHVISDPATRLAGGRARGQCGNVPLLISNTYGKGRAVLLNFAVTSFPSLKSPETPRSADRLMRQLFADAGIQARIHVLDAKGERERNVEVVRWSNSDSGLIALFRENGELTKAKVTLEKPVYVYDLRRRAYLGLTDRIETEIIPCRATFFALTSSEMQPPKLFLEQNTIGRGSVARVGIRGQILEGATAVRLTAFMPDGKEAEWLRQVVIAPMTGITVPLPIAFNDPAGNWKVSATELFSQKISEAMLVVQ